MKVIFSDIHSSLLLYFKNNSCKKIKIGCWKQKVVQVASFVLWMHNVTVIPCFFITFSPKWEVPFCRPFYYKLRRVKVIFSDKQSNLQLYYINDSCKKIKIGCRKQKVVQVASIIWWMHNVTVILCFFITFSPKWEVPFCRPFYCKLRLEWRWFSVTNTLAYYCTTLITVVKKLR